MAEILLMANALDVVVSSPEITLVEVAFCKEEPPNDPNITREKSGSCC